MSTKVGRQLDILTYLYLQNDEILKHRFHGSYLASTVQSVLKHVHCLSLLHVEVDCSIR